ncbi:type III-B CRISPR module RAMP protein Cmr1 [Paenibacillus dendritiformis]|uniref:type III-B CRISPR module RAMP protein Cmr1 n=1 Tax=Paenibacillus dendritiformis TaxID=130049 RepID=UPI0015EC92F4|nr:type III-B CRISPR module RAMP protein Cmr1 [Paenibacillus dendritiformis]
MKTCTLNCTIISPMFSSGNRRAELRPSELKGLMRYMFRAAILEPDTKELYQLESKYFGNAEKDASPVRLQFKPPTLPATSQKFLLHRKEEDNNRQYGFRRGTFELVIRTRHNNDKDTEEYPDIKEYEEWIALSLVLGGMGKRTRRGRGCVALDEQHSVPKEQLLNWIADKLNKWNRKASITNGADCGDFPYRIVDDHTIETADLNGFCRPVIEKIILGKEIKDIDKFLGAVDRATHRIKKEFDPPEKRFATGFVGRGFPGTTRFASSVIVSVTRTADQILLPVYTYVKAIYQKDDSFDTDYKERNTFISFIEGGYD